MADGAARFAYPTASAGFLSRVVVKSVDPRRVAGRSDETTWGVRVVFYVVERN